MFQTNCNYSCLSLNDKLSKKYVNVQTKDTSKSPLLIRIARITARAYIIKYI